MKIFGELSIEEKLALHRAFYEGKKIEYYSSPISNGWVETPVPQWADSVWYRVKPVSPLVIPWEHIHSDYKWAAADRNGEVFVYKDKPKKIYDCWINTDMGRLNGLVKFTRGDVFWEDSLIERPSEV